MDRIYSSGSWRVKPGSEDEFVARWTEFTKWSQREAGGAQGFVLIRQVADPLHFVSFGLWESEQAAAAWRARPEFRDGLAACRELCDEFLGGDYTIAADVRS